MRATKAIIDLSALRHNFNQIQSIAKDSRVMAVVKADAYGHGLVEVAQALKEAEMFAVATLEEAIELRQAEIKQPILLLEGFIGVLELAKVEEYDLQVVLHHWPQIEALQNYQFNKKLKVWVKLDSGMYRLGFEMSELGKIEQALKNIPAVDKPINLMSHFASADDLNNEFSNQQLEQFLQATNSLVKKTESDLIPQRSMANSAGILAHPKAHLDWVRPGLILYGYSPIETTSAKQFDLHPVMSLESQLLSIKPIKPGESTGYGRNWFAKQDTKIGMVAIGYGDGYPRHAKNGTPIWLNGRLVPLVGRVSMDMLAVDLGANSSDQVGDRVVLWGKELPMETVAPYADTIPYTLCCGVTKRVSFEYLD